MASKFTITAELNLQTKNLSQVVNNLKQQFQGADLNIKIKDLAKAEASLRNISSGAKDASASMGMLGGSINQAFRRFTVVTLATGTIVGFTRALKNAVGDAIEFERELVKIAQATGQSVAQLRGLATEVGNVSSSFGVSSKELILAARSLTQAGFAADKVTGSLKILAQTELAATFDSIANTTEGAIAILNQFGKQAQKTGSEVAFLEKSFSAINQVSKEFAVESSDLVTAVRTTGAAFESAGGSLNELLALFTSVRSTTRESAESISTGFRTIFTRIQRVDTINNLKALGIQLQDVEGKFVGPMEATKRLSMALSTIDPRDFRFNLIVEELGGFRQVSKVIPLIQQFATTQKALNVAQGSSGSLAKDAQTAQLSLAVQISKTREEFLRFIRDLTATESFQGTVRTLLNMANAFIKVADTIKPLIPLLGAFAALRIGQSIIPAIASVAGGRNRKAEGGVIHKFATGGLVPGQGNGDTVPAMLTPGEFVIRKSSVKQLGVENLARVNKYAGGGKIIGSLGGVASNTSIFKDNKDIGLQRDRFQVSVRRIKIPINESIYDKLEKGGKGWEDYLAKKYGYKQYPSAAGEKNTESDFRYPIDMESESSYIDAKDFKSTSSVPIVEGYKKSLSHLLYQKYKSKYKFQGASKNIINASDDGDDNFYGTKLTENSDPIISPKNMLLLFPDVKKGFALGGLIQKFALGGPAGKSRAARAITIPRIDSYTFDKPAGADLDAANAKKQQYKLNAEDRLDYDVNNVNVDVSKLKVSKGLLEQYNTADDQKRGFRFEDILKETGMAKSLSQVSNARLDGVTAAGDPFEAKSRKSAIGIGELEDKLYGAISDNISDPEKLARARFNANALTENEDHIKLGKVTVFEDITGGLGAAVKSKARMGYAEEEAAKQAKEQGKMTAVNAQQRLKDLVDKNFNSGYKIFGTQYSPIKEGVLHRDVASLLNKKLGGPYQDKLSGMSDEEIIKALNGVIVRKAMGGGNLGTDTVPAMLTPGEYVINKKSAQAIGYGALNRMNKVGKFAEGGPVQFLNSGGMKNAFGSTTNVTAQPFANFTATTTNPYPKASSGPTIDVLSSALEQSAKTIGQGAEKVTNKFGDLSDQLLLFGPAITGAISQMGMFDKATADMVSATTFTFSTIKGVGGNLTQQAGKYFNLKEDSKGFKMLNAGVTAYALTQSVAAVRVQSFGQTVETEGKRFASFVESLSNGPGTSKDAMTQALTEQFKAASQAQTRQSSTVKAIGAIGTAIGTLGGGAAGASIGALSSVGIGAAPGAAIGASVGGTAGGTLAEEAAAYVIYGQSLKKVTEQANALSSAMYSATESNREFQKFFQNIDKESPEKIAQQSAKLAAAYKLQSDELSKFNSTDLASASDSVKQQFQAVSEAAKLTAKNLQNIIGAQLQQAVKRSGQLVAEGYMPDNEKILQPTLDAIRSKNESEYAQPIKNARTSDERAGIVAKRETQIAIEQNEARKALAQATKQQLEMTKALVLENNIRKDLIGSMQKQLAISAGIERTAYELAKVSQTVSNIDAVFSGSLTGLKSSYDPEALKMKSPDQGRLDDALAPVRAIGPVGKDLSDNILNINKVMPNLEAKLLEFSKATDTASGGLFDVASFVKTAFNIDPNGLVGKTLVNIIEGTTRGTSGTNSVTASTTSLRNEDVRKRIVETFQKFGEEFRTQASGIIQNLAQAEQEGRAIAEKINESRQKQLDLAIQGVDTFSQYVEAISKARGRDMTLMEKNTIRNMRQYSLAGSMGNNSAALGQRLNKIYADLNKGGLSTEEAGNLSSEAKNLTKALEGLANQSDKTADILQEIDKVKKNRENLRELGREFGTGTAEDKDKMQQDMAAAMTVAQTGTYDSIPEEMRKGADAMLERFKDIPVFKQAQNRAIANTFMQAGNPLAAQMVLQETSTPEQILINELNILFNQQIMAQQTLSAIEGQRQEFLRQAQVENTNVIKQMTILIDQLIQQFQAEADAKAKPEVSSGPKSLTDVQGEKNSLANPNATAIGSMGIGNGNFVFNAGANAMGRRDLIMPEDAKAKIDTDSMSSLNENIGYMDTNVLAIDATIGELNVYFTALKDNLVLLDKIFEAEKRKNEATPVDTAARDAVMGSAPSSMNGLPRFHANGGLIYRADGGSIFQPKGTDTVHAMLTPGEFVIKKSSVDKIGVDTLSKINAGAYAATGGLVSYLAEGGESIAQGGAKVNNITLKRVYDQLQAIDKRVAFLEREYKALSVLISSGALGGGQQMAQQGGGQQMAQQGGGQQQMANQPQGNGLRSVPPQANPAATPPKDDTKADDNTPPPRGQAGTAPFNSEYGNKPIVKDKKTYTPVPPGPETNFRNGLWRDPDGRLLTSPGGSAFIDVNLPEELGGPRTQTQDAKTGDIIGWKLEHNKQRLSDYNELNRATSQAQRRAFQKKQKERDVKQADVLGTAVDAGTATPEQKQEYQQRFGGFNLAKQRREQDERVKATQAEEKADPSKKYSMRRPSPTATWNPQLRVWEDLGPKPKIKTSEQIYEEQTTNNVDSLEARLLGLTGSKPIKPEDRPAAEAKLKALKQKAEDERISDLRANGNDAAIAREAEAEIKVTKDPERRAQLEQRAETARAEAAAKRETQSKADAEKRNARDRENELKKANQEAPGTYADPETGKRVRDVEFDPTSAGTGPQLPFEVEKARRAAAVEEKNKKDAEDSAKRGVSKLLPSNEDIANKLKTGLKGFQEKNIAATAERKQMEEEQRAKEERMASPEGQAVAEENRRKQTELLNYKPKSKTDALPMKSNKPPQFLRDAKGNQNAAEARDLAAMRGDLSGTPGKILGGPGAGILQGLAGIGGLPPLLADTVAGTDFTPKYQNFVEKNVPNQTGAVGEVAKFAGTALAATVTSGASALGYAPTLVTAAGALGQGVLSEGVGELTGRTLDAFGVDPLAQAGLGLLTSVGTNRMMGAKGKVADNMPPVVPPVVPTKKPPASKVLASENATMPKGTTRDEVLRDFRAGDVQNPASVNQNLTTPRVVDANPESDFYSHLKPSTPWPAQHGESNVEHVVGILDAVKKDAAKSSEVKPTAPVATQPYQVDTTQVNTTQANAQTNAAVQAATAPATSTAPVTETYVNPTAVTSKEDLINAKKVDKPRGVLNKLSSLFDFLGTDPVSSTPKTTAIPSTSPADDILKAVQTKAAAQTTTSSVSPYKAGEKSTVQEEYSYTSPPVESSLSYKGSVTPITDATMKDAEVHDRPTIDAKNNEQKKASGGLITYLANGGPFHGMPRSGGAFNNFGNAMAGSLNDTSNWMTTSYNDYAHAPAQAFNDTGNWMTGSFNDAASGMTGSFNDAASGMTNSFNNMANFMSGSFQGAGNWMTGSFNDAASGMTNSFNNFAASFEKGGLISYLARGGSPKGTDTIHAMLTPGEFVMQKEAVDKHGTDFMEKLNKGGEVPGFATGGLVNYFRNGGRSGSIAEARARQFNDPRNAGRLEHVARMQTAATGSSYIAQAGAAFAPQRYGNMGGGGNGGEMQMQQGGGQMQIQQGPAENKQQVNGGGLKSVAPSPTGSDSGSTGGGSGAPNMSEVTTALNNMSTAFTGFTDKLNALATAFSGLTITHNIVFGGQINVGGVDGPTIVKALEGYVNTQVTNAIAGLRGENGQAPSKISPVAKQPGQ
jgi:hypothetical protein